MIYLYVDSLENIMDNIKIIDWVFYMRKKTTAEFIEQAKLVHGDKYDYSLVEYVSVCDKVKIMCLKHGIFEQTPNKHIGIVATGCPKCGVESRSIPTTKTLERFIQEAVIEHGDSYDYSLVKYKNTHTKVKIVCKIHGVFEQDPSSHLSGNGCFLCSKIKYKHTMIERYGVENPSQHTEVKEKKRLTSQKHFGTDSPRQSEEVKEKTKQTCFSIYGSTSPAGNKEVQEKIKQTNLLRYGGHPQQNKKVKDKTKQTNLLRYGSSSPLGNEEVQEKIKQTNLLRYGGSPRRTKEVQDKFKKTCIANYGKDHPWKNKEVQERRKQTNLLRYGHENIAQGTLKPKIIQTTLERYGYEHAAQNGEIKGKIRQTNILNHKGSHNKQQHMVDALTLIEDYNWLHNQYTVQHKTSIQIADELNINRTTVLNYIHSLDIEIQYTIGYSRVCIAWLEHIAASENIHIQHALNGGEYKIPGTPYRADGYNKETNTIYEFYGDYWHGNPNKFASEFINQVKDKTMGELYRDTIIRENKIKEMGYNLVVMWEHDFTKNV